MAVLLVKALHGWLLGPEAAGAVASGEDAGGVGRVGEEEIVDWVDTEGRIICSLPRAVVHEDNILHRGAGVMIRNQQLANLHV